MKKLLWAAMAVAFVCSTTAAMGEGQAADDGTSPQFNKCMDKAASTADMNDCYGAELKSLDERLNKAYKELMGKLDDDGKHTLKASEVAWLKYREAASRDFEVTGGTMDSLTANGIFLKVTAQRVQMLEERLEALEDM